MREDLERYLRKRETNEAHVIAEPQLNLADDAYTKPDILVRPAAIRSPDVRGPTALLVIEVADTRLPYDLGTKAELYSFHGVREYWVIDARTLTTKVHRDPTPAGYLDVREAPPGELRSSALSASRSRPELGSIAVRRKRARI